MTKKETLKLFENRKVRTVWDDEEEKWYFSIVDVVSILTDSADPKQYIKKMKSRDEGLKSNWGTICTQVLLAGSDSKNFHFLPKSSLKGRNRKIYWKIRIMMNNLGGIELLSPR